MVYFPVDLVGKEGEINHGAKESNFVTSANNHRFVNGPSRDARL